jgi:hypothetical protein
MNHEITLAMNRSWRKNIWQRPARARHFYRCVHFAGTLMALLVALACGPIRADTVRTERLLSFGTGSYWHHAPGINNAVNQFLGHPLGSGGGNSGGGSGGLGSSISANSPVDLRFHSVVALHWHHATLLRPALALVAGARFEYGRARYFVKDGVGPLLDDITAKLDHVGVSTSLALRHRLRPDRPGQIYIAAGLGAEVLWSRTRVTSALLDVRRTDRFHDSLAFASLEWTPEKAQGSTIALQLEWRDSIGPALRLSLQQQF